MNIVCNTIYIQVIMIVRWQLVTSMRRWLNMFMVA